MKASLYTYSFVSLSTNLWLSGDDKDSNLAGCILFYSLLDILRFITPLPN